MVDGKGVFAFCLAWFRILIDLTSVDSIRIYQKTQLDLRREFDDLVTALSSIITVAYSVTFLEFRSGVIAGYLYGSHLNYGNIIVECKTLKMCCFQIQQARHGSLSLSQEAVQYLDHLLIRLLVSLLQPFPKNLQVKTQAIGNCYDL